MSRRTPAPALPKPKTILATIVTLMLVVGLVVSVDQLRGTLADARERERIEAQSAFAGELAATRAALRAPADEVRGDLAAARLLLAELLLGSEREPEDVRSEVSAHARRLLDHADELLAAAERPAPAASEVVPVQLVRASLSDLGPLQGSASRLAEDLRAAAAELDATALAATRYRDALEGFVATTGDLPDAERPAEVVDAWDEEADRLEELRDALERLDLNPVLQPLIAAHLDELTAFRSFTDEAIDTLEAGEVDEHNDLVERTFDEERLTTVSERLHAALARTITTAVAPLEALEERSRGFAASVEAQRRQPPERAWLAATEPR